MTTTAGEIRLVSFSHGAGCGCKLGPNDLTDVLQALGPQLPVDHRLLVGTETGDDAAVYKLDDDTAFVFTTDFFTPIVDDAYDWGRIAAANALSDVYAMGGRPLLCLNLVGWPRDALTLELLGHVLQGGLTVAREAGAIVAGGHTIDDPEPKYGMAVVGLADPQRIVTNAAARARDVLVLTKPLGLGVISTAIKNQKAPDDVVARAIETMTTLNAAASQAMLAVGVRAATDVTGFGFLGHLHRMLVASGVSAAVRASAIPILDGARELAEAGQIPGGSKRNRRYAEPVVRFAEDVDEVTRALLADAQTSGGMLIACPPEQLASLRGELGARAAPFYEVGVVMEGLAGEIAIEV
ncbi:MAG TPA: selenide, water dikinase SelD [Actinomycetota bacterium]|nr:selenide, water dikinase SelD [Actinomycetota bacterium]